MHHLTELTSVEQIGFPILTALICLPLLVALILNLIEDDHQAYKIGLVGAGLEVLLTVVVALSFQTHGPDLQFVEHGGGVPGLGLSYTLGVDGLNLMFLPLIALLTFFAVLLTEFCVQQGVKWYLIAMLAFQGMKMGAFVSLDLMLFWFFFTAELIPGWFLITRWGTGQKRHEAAVQYTLMMLGAAASILFGVLLLRGEVGPDTPLNYATLLASSIPAEAQGPIFLLLMLGLAIKLPIVPFHTWLPRVLAEGPIVAMTVFLVGVKLGAYGILRFVLPFLPDAAHEYLDIVAALGATSILYGGAAALVQVNLRRLLAFGSVAHMGVVVIGLFSLNFYGLQGGLLHMANLGLTGAGLFFVAAFIHTRLGPQAASVLSGLSHSTPVLAAVFLALALASIGLPGTSGFNADHLIVLGALSTRWWMAVFSAVCVFVTACYFLRYFRRAFLGPIRIAAVRDMPDLRRRELFVACVIIGMVFTVGLFTEPFLQSTHASLHTVAEKLERGEGHAGDKPHARIGPGFLRAEPRPKPSERPNAQIAEVLR